MNYEKGIEKNLLREEWQQVSKIYVWNLRHECNSNRRILCHISHLYSLQCVI